MWPWTMPKLKRALRRSSRPCNNWAGVKGAICRSTFVGQPVTEKMQAIAKELVALNPHLILTRSTPVTAAFLRQSRTIPIVFTVVSDPVGERFVESLARPGGNAPGFTNVESSLTGKWLELLKEIAPRVKRVAFLFNPKLAPGGGSYFTRLIEASAPRFSIAPTVAPINGT